eukprot:m.65375 g.65375  ORF g.65375 m.65375 type:complete len:503 (-) comp11731_c0_seq1:84-1592(-)
MSDSTKESLASARLQKLRAGMQSVRERLKRRGTQGLATPATTSTTSPSPNPNTSPSPSPAVTPNGKEKNATSNSESANQNESRSGTPLRTPSKTTTTPSRRDATNTPTSSRRETISESSRKRRRTQEPSRRGSLSDPNTDLDQLLAISSHAEEEKKQQSEEILDILSQESAMEASYATKFKSAQAGDALKEFCPSLTAENCMRDRNSSRKCSKVHFRRIITRITDVSLGDCTFLNTCKRKMCRHVHYAIDEWDLKRQKSLATQPNRTQDTDVIKTEYHQTDMRTVPEQWIQCDVRQFNMEVIGKFSVIMADPPWDIHMELPYGTMSDDEMRKLPVKGLSDDGYIFLWVTGRAMELGRQCLKGWGYEFKQELLWVKTNQLQKLNRSGRTGHWLNHCKEHCLIGIKGKPQATNRVLDCDVIVAEVRDTSHKPDEVYGLIERLSPGTRKLELFGRQHNTQKNWVTLGNQVHGVNLLEPDVVERFKKAYPYDSQTTQRVLLTGKHE